MLKVYLLLFAIVMMNFLCEAQTKNVAASQPSGQPKLVIGLVVDQMRWDYLYRYQNRYGAGGFKRLLKEGFSYQNTNIPTVPTYTAVGHSGIYTGSVPAITGIIGNNWFDKNTGSNMYCTQDSTVEGVGATGFAGRMSPANMWTTTITDELRLATNFKSKTFGISLKDRGAILPAGHSANAAYWFDDRAGKMISSTYYMTTLPQWVTSFNEKDLAAMYMKKDWNTLYPLNTYTQSTADENKYEAGLPGLKGTSFPYQLSTVGVGKYATFKYTPYANTYSFDFAKSLMVSEQLGVGNATDFLTISISGTDYTGHNFGPNAIEIEDLYLRLDADISNFLTHLDGRYGKNNYLLFLSADHGAAHVPAFLKEHRIPAGTFDDLALQGNINKRLSDEFGISRGVLNVQNYQVYLDETSMLEQKKDLPAVYASVIRYLEAQPYITMAFPLRQAKTSALPQPLLERFVNGYSAKRSGDIQFLLKPAYFDGGAVGTTHGLWNPYDAHIPLIFFGWKVKAGETFRETSMADIAPTLAAKLRIQAPNGSVGIVLPEVANNN